MLTKTLIAVVTLLLTAALNAAVAAIATTPLFLTASADPRVLLAMSRDHQLYIKAYTDYADLNPADNDGIDTTYNPKIDYYGYFDSEKCYDYSSNRFEPFGVAGGTYKDECTGHWSGNFLNWATMTRMDIVRKVLYGGYRSTDTAAETVLERAILPYDVHSFAKVYTAASEADMQKYLPYAKTQISICNFTDATSGLLKDVDTSSHPPLMRIAEGSFPRWAASEITQCQLSGGTQPTVKLADYNVRVQVCVSGVREGNCKDYPNKTSGTNYKPAGIVQRYGQSNKPLRFGLMTGSFQKNKSGGVLRRNVERISGNANVTKNEIDTDGLFINQGPSDAGIVNTLNRLRISSYHLGDHEYKSNCDSPGILNFNDGECVDWGNPLSETYLEALRYMAGKTDPTSAFNAADSGFISSLPQLTWIDPVPTGDWCAKCSIIAISTGLNSFDRDQLSNDLGIDAAATTNAIGALENINGGTYLYGGLDKSCTGKVLAGLADAEGICPEVPTQEGGYQIAGLAYHAHTHDLRPDQTAYPDNQTVTSYSVALAENLPRFEIPAGSGTVALLPACEANSDAHATSSTTGWRACSLTDLVVEQLNYDTGKKLMSGSFLVNWEDSTWGNDHDMDGIERLGFCVGAACGSFTINCPTTSSPSAAVSLSSVGDSQITVITCAAQAQAGHTLRFGYTVTGSTADGINLPVIRGGGQNFIVGDNLPSSDVTEPTVVTHTQGASTAKLLENPLWYMAKYGSFTEIDDTADKDITDDKPNLASEWDSDGNGLPDGFFKATNPSLLEAALDNIINDVIKQSSSASAIATNSTRLDTTTLVYQAKFDSTNWTGSLLAFEVKSDGDIGERRWDAAEKLPTHGSRSIYTFDRDKAAGSRGIPFVWDTTSAGLSSAQQAALNTVPYSSPAVSDTKGEFRLNYLRGDQSKELKKSGGEFRDRTDLLGDVINSDPWFTGTEDFGYDKIFNPSNTSPTDPVNVEGSSYLTYRAQSSYLTRRRMIYIGANDGMLHGVDATDGTDGGKEIFAYVPNSVFPNLGKLTSSLYGSPSHSHEYFVDGAVRTGDAYIRTPADSTVKWRTVLVGATGAGAKGIFALDVTEPDSFAKEKVMWEFTSADDADLGYTIPQPTIVRMANGQWAAIVANGYESTAGKAVLFILNLADGSIIKKLDTGVAGNTVVAKNGLSTPIPVDRNGDHRVDYIYAGDLLGNLWKFDVSCTSANLDNTGCSSGWSVVDYKSGGGSAAGNQPLFVACAVAETSCSDANRQPITAKPQVGNVGATQAAGGLMVYFGTGKYFEEGDGTVGANPQLQTFYGIWDKNTGTANTDRIDSKGDLQEQEIVSQQTEFGLEFRVTSDCQFVYTEITTSSTLGCSDTTNPSVRPRGWFMNLAKPATSPSTDPPTKEGERVVSFALLRNNRVVFTTLIPSSLSCDAGGNSWLMELDATTGRRLSPANTPWDIYTADGKNAINSNDLLTYSSAKVAPSGMKSTIGIIKTPGVISAGTVEYKYTSGSGGKLNVTRESVGAGAATGRQSWIQIQ
ncbi:pilus assembly protein [Methylococcus sp. EFPC2]|uniref:pilus assembly protein n=1 Tax=Methylococcus sp. EFPC2 TaxID=2812648 RepID=UPI001966DAF9|nr:PilC/PilY family type IV pilus protein [Methylococcus sp. EFPC2]QSA96727.1 hypothetical protein JWZ97_16180 [Methylococcus sp. EFPC2]